MALSTWQPSIYARSLLRTLAVYPQIEVFYATRRILLDELSSAA